MFSVETWRSSHAVPVHEDPDELGVAKADARLLAKLAMEAIERMLALLDEAAGQVAASRPPDRRRAG